MKAPVTPVVPALVKALDILEYLAVKGGPATTKEIAADLGIPPASAYRTVKYLASRRYLVESPRLDGAYEFGPQISYLAHLFAKQTSLVIEARAALQELADQTGQTSQLAVLQDHGVTYVDQCLPAKPVSIIATLRTILPVNLSACGKTLVAHLPPPERAEFLRLAPLVAQTRKSIVDAELFAAELDAVLRQGYALDQEEYARGIGCLAAPIWDYRQQVVGAIGVTGHIAEYNDPARRAELVGRVTSAASTVSARMGMTPEPRPALAPPSGPAPSANGASAQGGSASRSHSTSTPRSEREPRQSKGGR